MRRRISALIAGLALAFISSPVVADVSVVQVSTTITDTSNAVVLYGLNGQSSCTLEINGTASGTIEGLVKGVWTQVDAVATTGTPNPSPTVSGPGTFTANCAGMASFEIVPTAVTGSATITITASPAVGRVLGMGVNGGRTSVVGSGPISVTNSGATATVGVNNPAIFGVPLSASSLTGTGLTAGDCVQAGTGGLLTTIASPCGSATTIAAGTNIVITGSTSAPTVNVTSAPSFSGGVTALNSLAGGSTAAGFQVATTNGNWPNAFAVPNNGTFNHYTSIGPDSTQIIHTISGVCLSINDSLSLSPITGLMTMNCAGDVGIAGSMNSAYVNISTLTPSQCVATDANNNLVSSGATCGGGGGGVSSVSGTGNISSTGGTTPVISMTAAPTFAGPITSTSGTAVLTSTGGYIQLNTSNAAPPAGYYIGTTGSGGQNPQAFLVSNSTNFYTGMGSDSTHSSTTVAGTCLNIAEYAGTVYSSQLAALDCSGNFGVNGAFYSTTGTIQTSLRAAKSNITDVSDIGMDIVRKTKIVKFCYKVEHCKAGEALHIGFIADDTDSLLSTKKHNGEDIGGTAALALYGAQEADKRITALSKELGAVEVLLLLATATIAGLALGRK